MSDKGLIFRFFDAANKGDFDFVDSLDVGDMKSLSPFVLLMWFGGAETDTHMHTILTDIYCNDKVFVLHRHPKLLLQLFIAANCDIGNTRYKFRKAVSSEESKVIRQIADYYRIGYDTAKQYKDILSKEDIDEIQEIMNDK